MSVEQQQRIPEEFWDKNRNRWDTHRYFDTKYHWHIADYGSDPTCDLMLVETGDGRYYIEDVWGGDADGHPEVFNPFDRDSYPVFFATFPLGNRRAAEIVGAITGSAPEELMIET